MSPALRNLLLLFAGLELLLLLLGVVLPAWGAPSTEPVVFSVIGDVPYGSGEIADLQQHIDDHNRYSPSAFLIHVGDIQAGSETCQESRYLEVADILKQSEVPAFIVPGDNEWVDCSDPDQAWAWWEQHLLGLEQNFCGTPPLESQAARPENFGFVLDGVLFIGLNYVSGSPSSVTQASAAWVDDQFAAHGGSVRAAVLMAQKEPGGPLLDAVVSNGQSFGKPVLYIHGNGHSWKFDEAFFGEPNMLRVQVDRGTLSNPPVQVTVTATGNFAFEQDPWPPGTPEINRGPCGSSLPALAIDDLFVMEGNDAVFTVTLQSADGSAVSVDYATSDDTARAGEDYQARSGSLGFGGSTTQRQITIPAIQDPDPEPAEGFFVNLSNASGASIAKPQGAAVILDNDTPPVEYTLTVVTQGSGTVGWSPSGGSHLAGTVVTLTAQPAPGWQFSGWSGDLSGSTNPRTLTMDADKSVWATFTEIVAPQHLLSVTLDGSGSVALSPAGGVYDAGTLVTLTATPGAGSAFSGWSGDLTGTASPTTLTMNADKTVTATFVPLPSGGGVLFQEVASGGSTSSSTVSTAAPVLAVAGDLYLAAIAAKRHTSVTGVSGLGLTWTPVGERCAGRDQTGIVLYQAQGNPSGSGVVTATLASAPGNAVIAVSRYSGAAASGAIGSVGSMNSNGVSGACSGGIDSASYAFDLATTAPDSLVFVAAAMRSKDHLPGAGYSERTQRYQGSGGSTAGVSVADRAVGAPATLSVNGSFSNATDWAVLAVEIRAGDAPTGPFDLAVSASAGGNVSVDPVPGPYDAGTSVTLTATPDAGYTFTGWGGDLSGSESSATLTMNADRSVTASFARLHSVTTQPGTGGSITLAPPGGVYLDGSVVTVTASPDFGYEFSSWGGDLGGSTNPSPLSVDADKNVSASFTEIVTPQYTLTVVTQGSGTVGWSPSGGSHLAGTVVTLTAQPAPGWQFSGWSGDLSGSTNPRTLTMDADKSVWATFTEIVAPQHLLSVTLDGSGSVALSPAGGVYDAGTLVTLTATPGAGSAFSGWSGDLTGTASPTTLTMNADKTVTATFVPLPSGGGVLFQEVASGGSTSSSTVSTAAPVLAVAGDLYLAAIAAKRHTSVTGVSGLGLTWTPVGERCAGRDQTGIVLYQAQGNPSGSGVVTATLASAPGNAVIAVSRYSGAAASGAIGSVGSMNSNGVSGACSGGIDSASYAFDLATTAPDSLVFVVAAMRSKDHLPGAGYSERAQRYQGSGGSTAGVSVADRAVGAPATLSVNGSFSNATDWAVLAVEIRAGGAQ